MPQSNNSTEQFSSVGAHPRPQNVQTFRSTLLSWISLKDGTRLHKYSLELSTHQHVLFASLNPFFHVHPWHTHTGDHCSRCLKELPAELGCGADSPALQGAWHHRASHHLHCCHLTTFTPLLQGGEGGQVLLVGYAHHSLKDRAGAGVPAPLPLLVALAGQGIGWCRGARAATGWGGQYRGGVGGRR